MHVIRINLAAFSSLLLLTSCNIGRPSENFVRSGVLKANFDSQSRLLTIGDKSFLLQDCSDTRDWCYSNPAIIEFAFPRECVRAEVGTVRKVPFGDFEYVRNTVHYLTIFGSYRSNNIPETIINYYPGRGLDSFEILNMAGAGKTEVEFFLDGKAGGFLCKENPLGYQP